MHRTEAGLLVRVPYPETSAPEGPIDLPAAKRHGRITHNTEDLVAADILAGAIEYAETATRRTIQLSRWDVLVDSFAYHPRPRSYCRLAVDFELIRPPVVAVEEIAYRDAADAWQTLDLSTVTVEVNGDSAYVTLNDGESWPGLSSWNRSVRLRYRAGYRPHNYVEVEDVATPPRIPSNLATAIKELFSFRFDNRGNPAAAVPGGIDAMFWSERADL